MPAGTAGKRRSSPTAGEYGETGEAVGQQNSLAFARLFLPSG